MALTAILQLIFLILNLRSWHKMAGGRPTDYTLEFAKRICDTIATNIDGTRALCDKFDWMPHEDTLRLWRFHNREFSAMYLQAKSFQSELMMEQINDVYNNELSYYTDSDGNERIDSPSVTLAVAKANTLKWQAARLAPKIYGERKDHEPQNASETLSKIQELVSDLNKTNTSDI